MTTIAGNLTERSVLEIVREVRARRASGVLEVDAEGQRRRLYFVAGELHLPGSHPLAKRLAQEVEAVRAEARAKSTAAGLAARRRLLHLVERIAGVLADWREGEYRFEPDRAGPAKDLVGPLPTRRLLMLGATLGRDEESLLEELGGSTARLVAGVDSDRAFDLLGLSPEETFLLERLRGPMAIEQLVAEAPEARPDTLRRLAQMRAVGLVASVDQAVLEEDRRRAEDRVIQERLDERIRRSLEETPIEVDEAEHRNRVADLLARFGGIDYYELLELKPDAPETRVQEAYERLARLVHPSHASRLGLAGRDGALHLLFERATAAFRTLSDPESRRLYNARQLIDVSPEIGGRAREEEARTLARAHFERALSYSSAGDFHSAIQLLEQAVRIDRRSDYLSALARHLARNPNWRNRALETFRTALELDPNSAEIRFEMGVLHEEAGDLGRARASYSAALRADPGHASAHERLDKLLRPSGSSPGDRRPGGSLFDRIFRRG